MEELFRNYTAAFDALNGNAIASLYRLPCAISDADGVQTYTEKSALVAKFSANCKTMESIGYQKALFNILDRQELSSEEMVVNIAWRVVTGRSNIDFRSLYLCHQINHAWLIFSANVYQGSFGKTK
ncbi:hypothetical protein [Alteromonas sp. ASW11-130]|uniref:hypothetical protein n=1 Tax=Alteromonas sp. ASW11-130 TaxID=3015775 RepID=UPI002242280A|nr:hypothetical protein [Alteromonas sp. ASW11-130]MCW8091998.1 hypothetical protein [Alteromonas sp. ASW11-130]